jgi:hypothetical protein
MKQMSWLSGLWATASRGQHAQDVGLVLRGVGGAVKLPPVRAVDQQGVVPRAYGVEPQLDGAFE